MSLILANAGVPMLSLAFPAAFYLLIPVIALETWLARSVHQISFDRRLAGVALANAISTLVGWPLTWNALAALQLDLIPGGGSGYGLSTPLRAIASVTLQAAWLIPYESDLYWMVPTAAMVLMIPAFFVTIPIERLVLRFCWRQVPILERKRFVWRANLYSYALLVIIGAAWLLYSIATHQKHP